MQSRYVLPTLATVIIVGSLAALGVKLRWKAKAPMAPAATVVHSTPELDTAPVTVEDGDYIGVIVPPEAADLASRQEGKLIDVRVKVGERVKRDTVLALFDSRMLKHELGAAQAHLAASADKARRRSGTINIGGTAVAVTSDEDKSATAFDAAASAARVEQLKAAIEQAEVRAPFDGVVTVVYASSGNYLKPGAPVVRLIGDSQMRLRFAVPDDAPNRPALRAKVSMKLKDGRKLTGTVESISPEVETSSHSVFVDAKIDDLPTDCGDQCSQLAARAVKVSSLNPGEK